MGFCILYLAYEATNRHVFRRNPLPPTLGSIVIPATLVALGVGLLLVVVTRLNPWTGALWMNLTFVPIVIATAVLRRRQATDAGAGVAKHRFAMLSLFAFSL